MVLLRFGISMRRGVAFGLMLAPACLLNPQPEDPFVDDSGATGSGGNTATGGLGTGGSSLIDESGGGRATGGAAPSAAGVSGWVPEAACVAAGDDAMIDDATDCDATIALAEGRIGTWFAYDSNPELPGSQEPGANGPFTMDGDSATGCYVHVSGGGFSNDAESGYGYAGVGIAFLEAGDVPCTDGYDALVYAGVGFLARGSGSLRLLVETRDTEQTDGRPLGYAVEVPLVDEWVRVEIAWSDLYLVAPMDGAPMTIDPARISTLRFEPTNPVSYEFWLDDLEFVVAPEGAGGAGGATGAGSLLHLRAGAAGLAGIADGP
ncbi:MAG: hypothetical protein JW751_31215 [Polyangiaceae bacterium]|nr:hypothetical protein [Polyangiaceae bacterium]